MLNAWLADMSVPPPEEWHVADLCLIPKPSKPMTGPEALRPISLIHPISKALSLIRNNHIKPQLWQLVHDLTQMAYLEARSVQDALDRASAHCARVRAVLRAQQQNIHLRKQGHRPADCRGGVLLSVDLRQAFDVMPRSKLQEAMDLAKADPAAQHVILQLHAHASLRVTHGSQVAMLDTDNGIRQGCCLAPSLWVLYTGLILTYIRQQVSTHDSTVFADDFLFHWLVDSTDQLQGAFRNIAFVHDTLEAFGMTISPGKSAVLIGVHGSKDPTDTLRLRVQRRLSYLSRHVKSQHAEAYAFHAAVLKWLDDHKTAILSPCQFCGADFKVFYSDCASLMHRLLPLLLLQLPLKHLPPQAMETHMKDALRKEMAEVETQELMGAQDQANLLSAMMRRSAGALEPSAPSDPLLDSTRASTPAGEGAATEAAPDEPEAMETLRDQEKWPRIDRQDRSDRNWKSDTDGDKAWDQFGINRAQDNYVMFAQCQGVLSMVPELYVAAEAWKTMKKETPELLTLPLRAWLLKHWVDLMLKRMEMIMTSEDTIKQAKDMLILDDQCNVPYLEWNRSTRSLQIKRDRDPMTLSQVLEALKAMQLLAIQPLVVLRFHATRELCQEMKSE
ncbi:unnamed protein product, partial [Symbiodinium necroappetens]